MNFQIGVGRLGTMEVGICLCFLCVSAYSLSSASISITMDYMIHCHFIIKWHHGLPSIIFDIFVLLLFFYFVFASFLYIFVHLFFFTVFFFELVYYLHLLFIEYILIMYCSFLYRLLLHFFIYYFARNSICISFLILIS